MKSSRVSNIKKRQRFTRAKKYDHYSLEYYFYVLDVHAKYVFDNPEGFSQSRYEELPSKRAKDIFSRLIDRVLILIRFAFSNMTREEESHRDEIISKKMVSIIQENPPEVFYKFLSLLQSSFDFFIYSHIKENGSVMLSEQFGILPSQYFIQKIATEIKSIKCSHNGIDDFQVMRHFLILHYDDYYELGYSIFGGDIHIIEAVAKYWEYEDPSSFLQKVLSRGKVYFYGEESKKFETAVRKLVPEMKALCNNPIHLAECYAKDPLHQIYKEMEANSFIMSKYSDFKNVIESGAGLIELHSRTKDYEAWLLFDTIFNGLYEEISEDDYSKVEIRIDKKNKYIGKYRKSGINYKKTTKNRRTPNCRRFNDMMNNIESLLS